MFATPFSAPLLETRSRPLFGRFLRKRAQAALVEAAVVPLPPPAPIEDDEIPDLAQRVREVGEW